MASMYGACFLCRSHGHLARNCPQASTEVKNSAQKGLCYHCKQSGHKAFNCPSKPQTKQRADIKCFSCGGFGHYSDKCLSTILSRHLSTSQRSVSCYRCGKAGHYSDKCLSPSTTSVTCYNCGQQGHYSDKCPVAKPTTCYRCGQVGHYSDKCPHPPISQLIVSKGEPFNPLGSVSHLVSRHDLDKEKIIPIFPKEVLSLHPFDMHFRFAESQFYRMCRVSGTQRVTRVDIVHNPRLQVQYDDFKRQSEAKGMFKEERLTFHGTDQKAIEGICQNGFKVGGAGVKVKNGKALGQGVYTSEDPAFAQLYMRDGIKQLLFCVVIVTSKCILKKDHQGHYQQIVSRDRDQVLPRYIVHFQ